MALGIRWDWRLACIPHSHCGRAMLKKTKFPEIQPHETDRPKWRLNFPSSLLFRLMWCSSFAYFKFKSFVNYTMGVPGTSTAIRRSKNTLRVMIWAAGSACRPGYYCTARRVRGLVPQPSTLNPKPQTRNTSHRDLALVCTSSSNSSGDSSWAGKVL